MTWAPSARDTSDVRIPAKPPSAPKIHVHVVLLFNILFLFFIYCPELDLYGRVIFPGF